MIKLGLTGGIGSGKSTVSGMFAGLGAYIIDADVLAREALEPGSRAYDEALLSFGVAIKRTDGRIDRGKLAEVIFRDPLKREQLEAIVHPRVFEAEERLTREIAAGNPAAVVIFDAALLIESGAYKRMDKVAVVWCPVEKQLERLVGRGVPREEAQLRIKSQMPLDEKRTLADYVIENEGSLERTHEQVEQVYRELEGLARR